MKRSLILIAALAVALPSSDAAWAKKKHWDSEDRHGGEFAAPGHAKRKGGPPPWAPAHGYRAKQKYRYYPSHNVYHDPSTGIFWSLQGGIWGQGLPSGVNARKLGRYRVFTGPADEPWRHNPYLPR